jgi:leader peptidase (prepilin peptidase)/N-methyltransferase
MLGAVGLSAIAVPGFSGVLGGALAVVMIAVALYDARYFIIPDVLVLTGLGLGVLQVFITEPEPWPAVAGAGLRGLVLALAFWGVRAAYLWLRGREGIGLGDVKLAFVAGVWLDLLAMAVAVEIAALAALAAAAIVALGGRTIRRTTRIPFGLYLAPAIWIAWLLQESVLRGAF